VSVLVDQRGGQPWRDLDAEGDLERLSGDTQATESMLDILKALRHASPDDSGEGFELTASTLRKYRVPVAEYLQIRSAHPDSRSPLGIRITGLMKELGLPVGKTWRVVEIFKDQPQPLAADFVVRNAARMQEAGLDIYRFAEFYKAYKAQTPPSVNRAIEEMKQRAPSAVSTGST
jgi:hypothetical protein